MPFKLAVSNDLKNTSKSLLSAYKRALKAEARGLQAELERLSPKGVSGGLKGGWIVAVTGTTLRISHKDKAAEFKIRGRGPGKQPPMSKQFVAWARQQGIPPFAVAKHIAEKGTARWRSRKNFLGLRRDGSLEPSSPIMKRFRKIEKIMEKLVL
ncbi:MAG: hypothetical protein J7647_32150 [Cyanobacteria bacterium SBLK]|nr:hypothetical protein [Cyanobacteria bacterium SBLK]